MGTLIYATTEIGIPDEHLATLEALTLRAFREGKSFATVVTGDVDGVIASRTLWLAPQIGEVAARILAPMATLCGVAFAVPLAGTAVVATTAIRRTGLAHVVDLGRVHRWITFPSWPMARRLAPSRASASKRP